MNSVEDEAAVLGSLLRPVCYKFPRQPLFGNPGAKAEKVSLQGF